ncbi:M28 family peptidase [Terrisporobacter petrolearius]|uniref:M28 family peptidase n=1 Tax=Terrisporobacter petrolearius TaxID=1460447 RepID=UPI002342F5F5|nr:M28 family peptidase [Terrisporobacter petrolearius]MCC3863892.1 M28 family peptidase [Terrisporobacter petrolearius]
MYNNTNGNINPTLGDYKSNSQNIIATRKPKKVKNPEIVYVTAHYDSVPYAPDPNDNASGTSMLLELAKILKSYPIDKEIRFIACGAESCDIL